jgi:MSHA biogenesis protein MshG
MPNYIYHGRNSGGQAVSDVLEAPSPSAVADALLLRGIQPISIKPAKDAGKSMEFNLGALPIFRQKIDHFDILMFTRQLYTLLKAGVPIMRALAGLQESSVKPAMTDMLQDLRESLDSGRDLSLALTRHPSVFSQFYVSMVRIGEMTGRLEEIFIRLYEHMAFERFMKEQVSSALRYPTFVIVAMGIAMAIVNVYVIPAFAKVFAGFNAELPLMTKILLGFSSFMVNWWYVILGGIVAAFFGFRAWVATHKGHYQWDKIKLNLPIAGKIVRKATLARFTRSFALAMKSGVPIIQALSTVAQTVDNLYIGQKIETMREGVERGETILRVAKRSGIFPPVVMQMIAVGEESGMIEELMQEIAEMFQNEIEYELKTLAQQIEPILIMLLGAMVLVLALGIFLPLWDLGKVALRS